MSGKGSAIRRTSDPKKYAEGLERIRKSRAAYGCCPVCRGKCWVSYPNALVMCTNCNGTGWVQTIKNGKKVNP